MINLQVRKAERGKKPAKICVAGPSGSGKTLTSLRVARGLVGNEGDILVLDSENDSASMYADLIEFDTAVLPNYQLETYLGALRQAAKLHHDCVIVDSASHLWEQLLDLHQKMQGNSFANWKKVGGMYNEFVREVVNFPKHLIITTRAKMKYEQVEEGGKKKVEPIGLDPVMRDGFEYEVDLYALIDIDHNFSVKKTRMNFLDERIITKPGEELGEEIASWLKSGKERKQHSVMYRYDISPATDEEKIKILDWLATKEIDVLENKLETPVAIKKLERFLVGTYEKE